MEKNHQKPRGSLFVRAMIGRTAAGAGRVAASAAGLLRNLKRRGAAQAVLRFVLNAAAGFLLSRTTIFTEYAPFGVGFTAASSGLPGFAGALVGVLGGSLSMAGRLDLLKYVTAALLIVVANFLLRGLVSASDIVFPPAAAGAAFVLVGAAYLAGRGFASYHVMLSITEAVIAAGSGYFFRVALRTMEGADEEGAQRRSVCIFLLTAAILASLSQLMLLGAVSVGRILASALVMALAIQSGMYGGAVAGVILGVTMDLAAGNVPLFTAAYGLSGFIAGVFSRAGRVPAAAAYIVVNAAVVLWSGGGGIHFPALYEVCAASLIFAFLPAGLLAEIRPAVGVQAGSRAAHAEKLRGFIAGHLADTASVFRELQDLVTTKSPERGADDQNPAALFTGAASSVCKNCELASKCWNAWYGETRDLLNAAVPAILRKGRADRADLSERFTGRCLHLGEFVAEVNRCLYSSLCRKRYRSILEETRTMIGGQYADMSHLLEQGARSVTSGLRFDIASEQRVRKYIGRYGVQCSVLVYHSESGRCSVEIGGPDLAGLLRDRESVESAMSRITGRRLVLGEQENRDDGSRLVFAENPGYTGKVGASAGKKIGSEVSGDCGTYFKTADGRLYIILSDGMGSGREAAVESSRAVRLLERLLRAGLDAELAVRIVGSALFIRSEDGMRATIDLLCANLVSGACTLIKCGAAASYIVTDGTVRRIAPSPVPTDGKLDGVTKNNFTLKSGSLALLLSDGILGDEGDAWLRRILYASDGKEPKEIATKLLRASPQNGVDDMTAIALRFGDAP